MPEDAFDAVDFYEAYGFLPDVLDEDFDDLAICGSLTDAGGE